MKLAILALSLLFTACSSDKVDNHYVIKIGQNETSYLKNMKTCPKIHIKRADSTLIQKEGKTKAFEIIAYNHSGYCYLNKDTGERHAVITPEFKIIRLANVDVTDVQFSYYLESSEGSSNYSAKKSHFANVSIPVGAKEMLYTAEATELTMPKERTNDADVYFGLNEDISDLQFRK
jgi:hypothetical protein